MLKLERVAGGEIHVVGQCSMEVIVVWDWGSTSDWEQLTARERKRMSSAGITISCYPPLQSAGQHAAIPITLTSAPLSIQQISVRFLNPSYLHRSSNSGIIINSMIFN